MKYASKFLKGVFHGILSVFILALGVKADDRPRPINPRDFGPTLSNPTGSKLRPRISPPREVEKNRQQLKVTVDHRLDGDLRRLHTSIAEELNRHSIVPSDLATAHFAWLNDSPGQKIVGWSAVIHNVERNGRAYLITIKMQPQLEMSSISICVIERYHFANGTLTPLGAFLPEQGPVMIIGF